ncbi:hypothetical protein HDE68_000858 [Pedobacter cryoconitis]|uniref:Uncharacterized protein n=1 Tax=Pedobacter cryoconitis TaxID=188932 RepID=A0A7W9DXJ2_9SPHI|nr:hypothetical protein [Pedobacter cryoconitis]MBB5634973.1 hypothetical protein [Pedobacter cryoconitis]
MRILYGLMVAVIVLFLFLKGDLQERKGELPVFMKTDEISRLHQSKININIKATYRPSNFNLKKLKEDYNNLWAHLNHLYQTNDVEAGKEYYTENWFKFICNNRQTPKSTVNIRTDSIHHLNILNWSSDQLVCTAIDSNIILKYEKPERREKVTIAFVLLFQGDHWRLDALRIINIQPF